MLQLLEEFLLVFALGNGRSEQGLTGIQEVLQFPPLVAGQATGMEQDSDCKITTTILELGTNFRFFHGKK